MTAAIEIGIDTTDVTTTAVPGEIDHSAIREIVLQFEQVFVCTYTKVAPLLVATLYLAGRIKVLVFGFKIQPITIFAIKIVY